MYTEKLDFIWNTLSFDFFCPPKFNFYIFPFSAVVTTGWVSSAGARTVVTSQQVAGSPGTRASPVNEMIALQEKVRRQNKIQIFTFNS